MNELLFDLGTNLGAVPAQTLNDSGNFVCDYRSVYRTYAVGPSSFRLFLFTDPSRDSDSGETSVAFDPLFSFFSFLFPFVDCIVLRLIHCVNHF